MAEYTLVKGSPENPNAISLESLWAMNQSFRLSLAPELFQPQVTLCSEGFSYFLCHVQDAQVLVLLCINEAWNLLGLTTDSCWPWSQTWPAKEMFYVVNVLKQNPEEVCLESQQPDGGLLLN